MAVRTTRSSVTFKSPFKLDELDDVHRAGTFAVETDEEIVEGILSNVYIRVATLLFLTAGGTTSVVTVDPKSLEAALARDAQT